MEVTSRIQPNTIEEACLQPDQQVGNGHNIHDPAELQQHKELRHCWLPGQNNSLPFLIKNKTTRKHTHAHTRRQTHHVDILKFQHLNSSKSSQFSKQSFNILALYLQDIFANTGFTISNVLRALILHLQIQSNFKQLLVMSVGLPLFLQTNPTAGKFWL